MSPLFFFALDGVFFSPSRKFFSFPPVKSCWARTPFNPDCCHLPIGVWDVFPWLLLLCLRRLPSSFAAAKRIISFGYPLFIVPMTPWFLSFRSASSGRTENLPICFFSTSIESIKPPFFFSLGPLGVLRQEHLSYLF